MMRKLIEMWRQDDGGIFLGKKSGGRVTEDAVF